MIKFLVAVLFLTCPFTQFLMALNSPANTSPLHIQTENYEGVIFPAEFASDSALWAYVNNLEDYWTPNAEDIAQLEANLPAFLEANAEQFNRDIVAELPDYIRQYLGYTVEGQRLIYVNAVCGHGGNYDWRNELIGVEDGGDCYFQVVYNFETGEFSELIVNGQA